VGQNSNAQYFAPYAPHDMETLFGQLLTYHLLTPIAVSSPNPSSGGATFGLLIADLQGLAFDDVVSRVQQSFAATRSPAPTFERVTRVLPNAPLAQSIDYPNAQRMALGQ
jgi:hypothetical protein